MLGRELVYHLRESILDDLVQPYLWKDTELLRYLNYAEVQACRRAQLIIDAATAVDSGTASTASTWGTQALCTLVYEADEADYTLSDKVLQVKRCQLHSLAYPLIGPVSYDELDDQVPNWMGTGGIVGTAGSGGNPVYFLNETGNTVTFVRSPSADGTAALVVSRLPLLSFTLQNSPEISESYHEGLINWAAHLAYLKSDSDTLNLGLSQVYEAKFTQQFGPLPDAYSERMRRTLSQKQRMRPRVFGS